MDVELFIDVFYVHIYSFRAYKAMCGDHFVAHALYKSIKYFLFPGRKVKSFFGDGVGFMLNHF
jgi:hypothetical protein